MSLRRRPFKGWVAVCAGLIVTPLLWACNNAKTLSLELRVNNQVRFSQTQGAFGLYAWRQDELGPILPATSFRTGPPVEARFSSDYVTATFTPAGQPPIHLSTQSEVALFSRDPQEIFSTFKRIGDDPREWDLQVSAPLDFPTNASVAFLPDAAMVPFGPRFGRGNDPKHPLIFGPMRRASFWLEAPAGGPGAAPSGDGSIKAVRIYPIGMCSREEKLQPLLESITVGFADQFIRGVCDVEGLIPDLPYVYSSVYLAHETQEIRNVNDGFFLAAHLRVHDNGIQPPFSFDDCTVVFNYNYRLKLDDGLLAIEANRNQFVNDDEPLCTGFLGRKGVADRVADALALDLPAEFSRRVMDPQHGQAIPLKGFDGHPIECSVESDDPCLAAVTLFETGIRLGAKNLGLSENVTDQLLAASGASDPQTGKPHRNYRCAAPPGQASGQCQYLLRAKRINVLPDAIELVWFDEGNEYQNPAFAAFVASLSGLPGTQNQWQQLCNRTPSTVLGSFVDNAGNYYPRPFAKTFGNQRHDCPVVR